MKILARLIGLSTLALPQLALAHAGHGAEALSSSLIHYITTPTHALTIALGVGIGLLATIASLRLIKNARRSE